jgi:hypothetical protein
MRPGAPNKEAQVNASLAGRSIGISGFCIGLILLLAGSAAWFAIAVFLLFAALAAAYRRWGVPVTWFKTRGALLIAGARKTKAVTTETKTGAAIERA